MGAHHAERLKRNPFYNIAGAYDTDSLRMQAAVSAGLKAYPSFEAVGADKNVNAVLIATPNDIHPFYAGYFAGKGKNIICEKPAANTPAEFKRMITAANKHKVVLAVNQNRRFDKDFQKVAF